MKKLISTLAVIVTVAVLLIYISRRSERVPASATPEKATTTAPMRSGSDVTSPPARLIQAVEAASELSLRQGVAAVAETAISTPVETTILGNGSAGLATSEVLGTARMIAAHAPLRVPEVANPESAANREILNTMVLKALARTKEVAPAGARAD